MNHGVTAKTPAQCDVDTFPHSRSGRSDSHAERPNVVPIRPGPAGGSGKVIAVLIADDHPVVREGLVALISRCPDMRVTAVAANGREAVEQYFAQRPDVGFLDLRMPIMDGVDVVLAIRKQEPAARLAIISSFQNEEEVYRAVQAGARGYVLKDSAAEELVKCIRAVSDGEMWIPSVVAAKLANRVATRKLTAREIEVLHSLASGKSNKEIGNQLNISEATVKVHVTHIFEKLKVTGRTQAIGVAVNRGLVDLHGRAAA
jgi:two-component system NarL family response regulator